MSEPSEAVKRVKLALEPYLHDTITRQAREDAARAAIAAIPIASYVEWAAIARHQLKPGRR